jgi:REP element-mobilizing transposase RayT
MPRPPRTEVPGGVYHVWAVSVTSRALFYGDRARERFFTFLNAVTARYSLEILAYVLLSTHYHMLVRIEEPDLSRAMQWLNSRFATAINAADDDRGHLFGARFGSNLVTSDAQLLATVRYIARNPVEAGMCTRPGDWRWSSYTVLVHRRLRPRFFEPSFVLRVLDEHEDRAIRKLEALVEHDLFDRLLPVLARSEGLTLGLVPNGRG